MPPPYGGYSQGYRTDVYAKAYGRNPTRARGARKTAPIVNTPTPSRYVIPRNRGLNITPAEQARYKASSNARNAMRDQVIAAIKAAMGGMGTGGPQGVLPRMTAPKVPVEPVAGNPYKGLDVAIGKMAQGSQKRMRGDAARARKQMKGVHDPGADIAGSLDAQLAGHAAELAAQASSLQNAARQQFATSELERRSQASKNRYEAQSAQIKADLELSQTQQLSASMAQSLAAAGLDPAAYANNPMGAAVTLGRIQYARDQELGGVSPSTWAQAAQYGLPSPASYGGDLSRLYTDIGRAQGGYGFGGGNDAASIIAALQAAGLLQGLDLGTP